MASAATVGRRRADTVRCASEASARIPPSPRLSARRMTITYFSVTTVNSDQEIRESTPSTVTSPSGRSPISPNASRIA
jgi:hypothetical protein